MVWTLFAAEPPQFFPSPSSPASMLPPIPSSLPQPYSYFSWLNGKTAFDTFRTTSVMILKFFSVAVRAPLIIVPALKMFLLVFAAADVFHFHCWSRCPDMVATVCRVYTRSTNNGRRRFIIGYTQSQNALVKLLNIYVNSHRWIASIKIWYRPTETNETLTNLIRIVSSQKRIKKRHPQIQWYPTFALVFINNIF